MESRPRAVFERLFGDGGSTDPATRRSRMEQDRSILDAVTDKVARLKTNLGARDVSKLDDYLSAVRDVERRILRAEADVDRELPVVERPLGGIPAPFEEHVKLMFDLQVVAYQADLTRVISFMMTPELTAQTYPELGVPDPHHALSHHENNPESLEKLTEIQTFHAGFVFVLPGQTPRHSGWRRVTSRPGDDSVWKRHEQQQPPQHSEATDRGGGWRGGSAPR